MDEAAKVELGDDGGAGHGTDVDLPPPYAAIDQNPTAVASASAAAGATPPAESESPESEPEAVRNEESGDADSDATADGAQAGEAELTIVNTQPLRSPSPRPLLGECHTFDGLSDAITTCPRQVENDTMSGFYFMAAAGIYGGSCLAKELPDVVGNCLKLLACIGIALPCAVAGAPTGAAIGLGHGLFNVVCCKEASEDPCFGIDEFESCMPR